MDTKLYKQALAKHFDTRADYGRGTPHAALAERLVRTASPRIGERVLDIATGCAIRFTTLAQFSATWW